MVPLLVIIDTLWQSLQHSRVGSELGLPAEHWFDLNQSPYKKLRGQEWSRKHGGQTGSKKQTSPIFYNVKTLERVTKKIITLAMLVGF